MLNRRTMPFPIACLQSETMGSQYDLGFRPGCRKRFLRDMLALVIAFQFSFLLIAKCVQAAQPELTLLLSLELRSAEKTWRSVNFYSNNIDPNHLRSWKYRLDIDGRSVPVPTHLLRKINWLRRSFSYDSQSGGISHSLNPCVFNDRSSINEKGWVLNVRYLTYREHRIVSDNMREVFTDDHNCAFEQSIRLKKSSANVAAVQVVEILHTIVALKSDK